MSKTITVIANAKFPQMKPAHHAHISKQGSGSSADIANRDAMHSIMADPRVKGKRATNIYPFTVTFNTVTTVQEESGDAGSTS